MQFVSMCDHPIQSDSEFEQLYLTSFSAKQQTNHTKLFEPNPAIADYPTSIDWRTKAAVSGIKDQVHVCE